MDRANNNSNTKRINFKQILIYYFSGTGNSRRIAEWMAECAYGIAHVINIENINRSSPISINPGSLLGIIFPTFGFAPPWIVIKFAVRLPRIKNCTSFIVASRGTTFQHGSFFISGLAGMNYYLIALILLIKGYRIKGLMGVDMPQYIIQYLIPVFSKKNTEIILSRAKIKAQEFIYKILLQKSHIINYDNIKEFVLGSALLPASIFYLVFVNFISAKLFYASNKCKGCNLCMKYCPVSAIIMRGKKNPRPY